MTHALPVSEILPNGINTKHIDQLQMHNTPSQNKASYACTSINFGKIMLNHGSVWWHRNYLNQVTLPSPLASEMSSRYRLEVMRFPPRGFNLPWRHVRANFMHNYVAVRSIWEHLQSNHRPASKKKVESGLVSIPLDKPQAVTIVSR